MTWSPYRIMWLFVLFDLPTDTKLQRHQYSVFRKYILKQGFTMFQYSVYTRHCVSYEVMNVFQRKIENNLPPCGMVTLLPVTDKQFGLIKHFYGAAKAAAPEKPQQLMLF